MKLSEAILLGRHLVKPVAGSYSESTPGGGCALTMGMKAIGATRCHGAFALWSNADKEWPWLRSGPDSPKLRIARMFDEQVMTGKITLEQLVDYVRSIEPAEEAEPIPEPTADDGYENEPYWSDSQTAAEMWRDKRAK